MTLLIEVPEVDSAQNAGRRKAKERLYVALQIFAWSSILALNLIVGFTMFPPQKQQQIMIASVQVSAIGLLITHYSRTMLKLWTWCELPWRRLLPRAACVSVVQGAVWLGTCYLLQRSLLEMHSPAPKNFASVIFLQWSSCSVMMAGWLVIYCSYHIYDRFYRLEVDRFRMETVAKQAELRALKSQLNPHFIFNSLNSLRALIDENPARAREAVTQLANLLRYSLQSAQLETVPFEQELRVVSDYLALEQVRHEERLRLRLDIPPEVMHWPCPPLLLQTLVENAVKYGIATRAEGGEIGIEAHVSEGKMTLRVFNPGQLEATPAAPLSTGLGLANAAERLRLLFGERSSLHLRAEGADLVVAEAVIPTAPLKV